MTLPVKPIKPKRIADEVADQLTELIYRGFLKPGDRLPSERELARQLQVSRPTVREAINKLVVQGLVDQRHGQGTFVRSTESADDNPMATLMEGQDVTLEHILEVRLGLECTAAALAAMRADERDIEHLRTSLEAMKADIAQGGIGHEPDISFHMAIAYATRNPVQVRVMRNLYDFLFFGIRMNLQKLYEEPANLPKIIQQHTAIYEAIRHRDSDEALEAMKRHIGFVLDFFRSRQAEG
ncbi:MAG: transcriptional regulator, GntR family [Desulfacinum sp.]|jgi:GntR family transcriptional repressor for pyruvate dehydrogenase complex|nr:transcriptional regulator, GntR family [Desulfacinum sp.]